MYVEFGKPSRVGIHISLSDMIPLQAKDPLLSIGMIHENIIHNVPVLSNLKAKGDINEADYLTAFNILVARNQQEYEQKNRMAKIKDVEDSASFENMLEGGAKLKKTEKSVTIQGRKRVIYTGRYNKRYVKVLGKFVALSSLK